MDSKETVRVFAPATVANVVCGFDIFGFALEHPGDIVTASFSDTSGVSIGAIDGDGGALQQVKVNVASVASQAVLYRVQRDSGVMLSLKKGIPLSSGLGGSAASSVAAAVAVDALLQARLSKEELLDCALEGERVASGSRHADNAAPALYGGFVLVRPAGPVPEVVSIPVPAGLTCAILHPHMQSDTSEGRGLLEKTVPLNDVVTQTANVAGLIAGLYSEDWTLIQRSLTDVIIEHQRSPHVPAFAPTKRAALDAGALGCSLSGSGPSIFALCRDRGTADRVAEQMAGAFQSNCDLPFDTFVAGLSHYGAQLLEEGEML